MRLDQLSGWCVVDDLEREWERLGHTDSLDLNSPGRPLDRTSE
ncbi:hypothetical protein [Spirillospora sp. NPDC048824]